MSSNALRNLLALLLLCTIGFSAVRVFHLGSERRVLRNDAMELSQVTYGLFDPTEWKVVISAILEKKVAEFELTPANREQARTHLIALMTDLLNEVEQVMHSRNKQKGFGGLVKNVLMDVLVDVDDIRSGIPRYADLMLDYVNDPANKEEMQCFIIDQLNTLSDKTEGLVDRSLLYAVMKRYGTADRSASMAIIIPRMQELKRLETWYLVLLGTTCLILFLLAATAPVRERMPLIATLLGGLVILVVGLLLPMIDIEASISEFSFTLIGEPIIFKDQVLFYQSKSILEVVKVLFKDGDPALTVVAALVLSFSVLIPTAKLVLSMIALFRGRAPKAKLPYFLVFLSGKWSMADVMVVAIFMAFIGFNGVVNSQLAVLRDYASSIHVLTTNNSSLEVGFYLFTGYCLLGLACAVLVKRTLAHRSEHNGPIRG
ncbi:MAG: paraquat-inducible protein A [Flavobacteriales bacterium]